MAQTNSNLPDPSSPEEQKLISEYHIATERYTAAVAELGLQRAIMKRKDYAKLLAIVEDARNECERVRTWALMPRLSTIIPRLSTISKEAILTSFT
jgi:hypothetical protein